MKITYAGSNGDSLKHETKVTKTPRLRDIVECPVCLKTPRYGAPVFQCRNGHIICRDCYKRVESHCPVCRVQLYTNTKIRCIPAEKIIERLYAAGTDLEETPLMTTKQRRVLESVLHKVVLCSDIKHDKRTKLLDVANELMDLWIEDTRDAESRILVIANGAQDAQLLEDWINNDFDFAPHMATCIHGDLDPFKIDLAVKMFFYSPPPPKQSDFTDPSHEDEENPYPGIPSGCCRFLVATVDAIEKLRGTKTFFGKVNHVINYELPGDVEDYKSRLDLMNNSEKNVDMGSITTIFCEENWNESGKFICDLEVLIKEAGQEIPDWLSEVSKKYSSLLEKERGLLSNLVITLLRKTCKLFQFIYFLALSVGYSFLKLLHFIVRSIITTFINNEVKKLKSVLWIVFKCCVICFIVCTSFFIIIDNNSMKERSDSLYLNLQHAVSYLYDSLQK